MEEIWVRGPTRKWDSGTGLVIEKGKNTGGALAVTKGLAGQVERLVGKLPRTLYGKNALLYDSLSWKCALMTVCALSLEV